MYQSDLIHPLICGRFQPDSNWCKRFCRPVPNHSDMEPYCDSKGNANIRILQMFRPNSFVFFLFIGLFQSFFELGLLADDSFLLAMAQPPHCLPADGQALHPVQQPPWRLRFTARRMAHTAAATTMAASSTYWIISEQLICRCFCPTPQPDAGIPVQNWE